MSHGRDALHTRDRNAAAQVERHSAPLRGHHLRVDAQHAEVGRGLGEHEIALRSRLVVSCWQFTVHKSRQSTSTVFL